LALRLGVDLALDNRVYEDRGPCALNVFDIVSVPPPVNRLPSRQKTLLGRALAYRPGMLHTRRELHVGHRHIYSPWLLHAGDETYLQGYFQDVRYFADHAATIRQELMPRDSPDAINRQWIEQIEAERFPVSVHVRRGDFVGGPGDRSPGYYLGRMEALADRNPTFFVFSDDAVWCAANLPGAVVVAHNAHAPHEDLRLMAHCRAHIGTPGSSFSDWGGLLQRQTRLQEGYGLSSKSRRP
jgi:hypothetical protein